MSNLFFEGTEKKVELVVSAGSPDLRALGQRRWREIVEAARANVLSCLTTEHCDAYLLSESSLFVFERKMLMITCGRTRLVDAVAELLKDVAPEDVCFLIFERKNEVFPHRQPTSFYEDARALNELLPGKAMRFGNEDEHHLYLYHLDRAFDGEPGDVTMEILMYGLDGSAADLFDSRKGAAAAPARSEAMRRIFPGYRTEEHLFEPSGYSLNGVHGEHYGTLHVTPQEHGSYASFETNRPFGDDPSALCNEVLDVFRPRAFDVVLFDQGGGGPFASPAGYTMRAQVTQRIDCGYRVRFLSHFRPPRGENRPHPIPIEVETLNRGSR